MDPLPKQPVPLTNEQVASLSQLATQQDATDIKTASVFQEAVSKWSLPSLQIDSITVWKIDTNQGTLAFYMATFPESPRLWSMGEGSSLQQTLCSAIGNSLSKNEIKQDILVPLWFTSPLTYSDFNYIAPSSHFACLTSAVRVFSEDVLPTIDFDSVGKTKTFEELNRFQNTNDPQLKEAHRENLKSYLNALRCSAFYGKEYSRSRSQAFTPLLTNEEFTPLVQALQLSAQEIKYCQKDGVVGADQKPSQYSLLLATVIVLALLFVIGGMLTLKTQRQKI